MGNDEKKGNNLLALIEKMPYFSIDNLHILGQSDNYLRIYLSRKLKKGVIIRHKKGLYTSKRFIDLEKAGGNYSGYLEYLSNIIYYPSYLSLEYVLYEHNLITEMPLNFTLITRSKPKQFYNCLGNFIYHKIRGNLFTGFCIEKERNFIIYKAKKMKALFDFLYLRKNSLINRKAINELRLNIDNISSEEKKELKKYVDLEGTNTMKRIYSNLL